MRKRRMCSVLLRKSFKVIFQVSDDKSSLSEVFGNLRRLDENIPEFTNLCQCYLILRIQAFFVWYVVIAGTAEHGTAKHGMPEHQIRNGKTRNTKSKTPIYGTVLSDGISKPRIVKTEDTGYLQEVF